MQILTGKLFKEMVLCGANTLHNNHPEIDALNVFPVPDGDTGTNMSMTFNAGAAEIKDMDSDNIYDIAKKLSKGLLMGARGNSGVILSQIFRGFAMGLEGHESVDAVAFANAWKSGAEVAYKAVMRPVEGTILTVIREASEKIVEYTQPGMEIEDVFSYFVKEAENSLERTPELLPVLKEVGVVDSGAFGYIKILEGFRLGLKGTPVTLLENIETKEGVQKNLENEEFGYCTEFIVRLNSETINGFKEDELRNRLSRIGDSLVVVQDEEIVKVHVHTLTPGDALNIGQRYGEFVKLKIENMQEQHDHLAHMKNDPVKPKQEKKKYAIIAVAAGDGVKELFESYRVDVVISGGQTMNPSTEDFVAAIQSLNAEHIFVLPNNSNIILAAQQAESLIEDMDVRVLPTKSIPQGLSACIMFNPEVDVEDNVNEMTAAFKNVKTAMVTYAIKDTSFEGVDISAGDYMGILEKTIVCSTKDKLDATKELLRQSISDDDGLVTILVGEDVSDEEQSMIEEFISTEFDHCEVEITKGLQPVYSFIFGIE